MEIRYLDISDLPQIKDIYDIFFPDMEFPDFINEFNVAYVVHEDNQIIAVGGLKPILEAVVLTDGDASVRKRRDALMHIHNALTYSAQKLGHRRIFAFSFDDTYTNHLIKRIGFSQVKQSKLLALEL